MFSAAPPPSSTRTSMARSTGDAEGVGAVGSATGLLVAERHTVGDAVGDAVTLGVREWLPEPEGVALGDTVDVSLGVGVGVGEPVPLPVAVPLGVAEEDSEAESDTVGDTEALAPLVTGGVRVGEPLTVGDTVAE